VSDCRLSRVLCSLLSLSPSRSPLFPYTTLFRSDGADRSHGFARVRLGLEVGDERLDLVADESLLLEQRAGDPVEGAAVLAQEPRSEEHTSELQSQSNLVCRLLLEKKKKHTYPTNRTSDSRSYRSAPIRAWSAPLCSSCCASTW